MTEREFDEKFIDDMASQVISDYMSMVASCFGIDVSYVKIKQNGLKMILVGISVVSDEYVNGVNTFRDNFHIFYYSEHNEIIHKTRDVYDDTIFLIPKKLYPEFDPDIPFERIVDEEDENVEVIRPA